MAARRYKKHIVKKYFDSQSVNQKKELDLTKLEISLSLLCLVLGACIMVMLEKVPESIRDNAKLKKENNELIERINERENKVEALQNEISITKREIETIERNGDKAAAISHEKIQNVATLSNDSVFKLLAAQFIPRQP